MNLRIKHGQTPGEISKLHKIQLLEKEHLTPRGRSFRKMVRTAGRTRAILKERTRARVGNDLDQ